MKNTFKNGIPIISDESLINLRVKIGPVGWNGLSYSPPPKKNPASDQLVVIVVL